MLTCQEGERVGTWVVRHAHSKAVFAVGILRYFKVASPRLCIARLGLRNFIHEVNDALLIGHLLAQNAELALCERRRFERSPKKCTTRTRELKRPQ